MANKNFIIELFSKKRKDKPHSSVENADLHVVPQRNDGIAKTYTKKCPNGHMNPENANFCRICGYEFSRVEIVPAGKIEMLQTTIAEREYKIHQIKIRYEKENAELRYQIQMVHEKISHILDENKSLRNENIHLEKKIDILHTELSSLKMELQRLFEESKSKFLSLIK